MKNLCIVCHPDDEILGFGGTASKLISEGDEVKVVFLCSEVSKRAIKSSNEKLTQEIMDVQNYMNFEKAILGKFPNLEFNNVNHFELVNFIEKQIIDYNPHRLFIHHHSDLNDDHRHANKACLVAARYFQRNQNFKSNLQSIYTMEILSSTDWSFDTLGNFNPNVFVNIEDHLEKKLNALDLYKNVYRDFPNPRSKIAIESLSKIRGSQSGFFNSESFECVFKNKI